MALTIECEEFKPFAKNSLRAFAAIKIPELKLRIKDVALHCKNGSTWAALPAKPQIKDGKIVTSAEGKPQYVNIFEFADRPSGDGFSRAVVDAVLKLNPRALEVANG